MNTHKTLIALSFSTIVFVATAHAVATRVFSLDDAATFQAGELDHTSVHSDGSLRPGPSTERVALEGTQLTWSLARTADATYVGTGTTGRILRIRGAEITTLAETQQLAVTALTISSDKLYAGTMPEGRIFEVDLRTSQMRELVRLEGADHIWALVFDPRRAALVAGTGPSGKIFSVTTAGVATVIHDDATSHILSLALDDAGTLFAGTSDRALVLRIPSRGAASVLWDFPGNEITALAYRNGALAVVANEFPEVAAASSSTVSPPTPVATTSTTHAPRPRNGKGKVFSLSLDGQLEQLATQDDAHFTAIAFAQDNALWIASAKDGRVLRVGADRGTGTILDVDERQIVALVLGDTPIALASDAGAIYRIGPTNAAQSTWTSKVLDADFISRFGLLTWRGRGPIETQTRSGSTLIPDDTWSPWTTAATTPGLITSPSARYLQARVRFASNDAVLYALNAYYAPQNQRAFVRDLAASARRAPTKQATPSATPTSTENVTSDDPPTPSTNVRVTWRIENPDADRMRFRIDLRGESQTTWRPLTRETDVLTRNEYTWDTSGFADGYYRLRVRASDELANSAEHALESHAESSPILIDNHAPTIEDVHLVGDVLTANIRDAFSVIAKLEIARNGQEWRPLEAADGLLDELQENVRATLAPQQGTHVYAIRATDAAGNSVIAEVESSGGTAR